MEYFLENNNNYSQFSTAADNNVNNNDNVNNNNNNNGVHFMVDDLFNFSNNDEAMTDAFFDSLGGNSGDSSAVDSCNSSVSGGGGVGGQFNGGGCRSFNESSHFSGNELCVPYDDLAELEWLSNFVEDSFSSGELRFIPTAATGTTKTTTDASSSSITTTHSPPSPSIFPSEVSVPGKARSKRSRAAPCDWSSRLLMVSPHTKTTTAPSKKREPVETPGRKCLHCASEKTPQWRTGPMGPKTLCNACGVRYKSGRLVPEYRPAASPTFVSAKHSNSHRKVMELRRQKELQGQQHHHHHHHHQQQYPQLIGQGSIFNGCDEFLIHQHGGINGPDLRRMV